MIICSPCNDSELILSVLRDDSIWNSISEDGMDKDTFTLPPSLHFFTLKDSDSLLGVCALRVVSSICAELHTCLLKAASGKSNACFNSLAAYLLGNTALETVITVIPETNKLAEAAAKRSGFLPAGFIPYSYVKNGTPVGQHIYQVIL